MFVENKDEYSYEFKIVYDKGGLNNYLERKPRGFRLMVTKYIDEGDFRQIKPMDSDNMLIFVRETKRYVKSIDNKLEDILDKNKDLLLDLYFNNRNEFIETVFKLFKGEWYGI